MSYNRSRTQLLALRNNAGELLGATSARCAAELARRHAGSVPQEAVEAVVMQFSDWLQAACEATLEEPARVADDEQG